MRPTARTRSPADNQPERQIHRGRLVVLGLAVALNAIAFGQAWLLWSGLPGVRLARLTRADYERGQRTAEASMSREARQGLIAANVSNLFTSVLEDAEVYPARLDTLQRMVSELRDTQLGRMQLVAFMMLDMERAGTPMEQWWPRLAPLLSGLERANFAHFLAPLEDNRTEMYRSLGLRSGAARAQAEELIGQPHGPLLQYLAPRLGELARVQAASRDRSDVLCQRLLFKLLRQCTLDDGPPGIRLLAADLLQRAITSGDLANSDASTGAQVAAQLRQWRAAYRSAAAAHPPQPYPIAAGDVPDMQPYLGRRASTTLWLIMWAGGALLAAALVSLAGLALARGAFLSMPKRKLTQVIIVGAVVALVAGGLAWGGLVSSVVTDDLRRLAPQVAGLPRTPIVAFCLLAILLAVAALPRPRSAGLRRLRAARMAVVAVWAWMLIGLCCLPLSSLSARFGSQAETDYVPPGDRIAQVAGPDSVHLLDALRAWQP